jgi:hypothetical protein
MTKEEIIDGNVLICEYMGATPNVLGRYEFPGFGHMTSVGNWKDEFKRHQLKFHSDWNWIMEAAFAVLAEMQSYLILEDPAYMNKGGKYVVDMAGDCIHGTTTTDNSAKMAYFITIVGVITSINKKKKEKALLED